MVQSSALTVFSQNLERERLKRHQSQSALAKKAGLTQAAISEMEQANRTPGLESLERLSRALGIPCWELLRPREEKSLPREQVDRIAHFLIQGAAVPSVSRLPSLDRELARRVGALVIEKLRAHGVSGKRNYQRSRWRVAGRARNVRQWVGQTVVQQILHRVDSLLAMGVR